MSIPSLLPASATAPTTGEVPSGAPGVVTPNDPGTVPLWRSGFIVFLAAAMGFAYLLNPPLNVQSEAGVVMDLPAIVGDFFGKPGEITKVELDELPKDTEFARRFYDDGHGHQVNCTIVLSGAEQRSIHRPEACLVGQGWTIVAQDNVPIPLQSGHKLVARRLSLERDIVNQNAEHVTLRAFYVYWFVGQNVTTPSEMERVLMSNWDRAIHNRAHRWAYVSLFFLITDNLRPGGLNGGQTEELLVNFASQIVPTFQISEMPAQAKD